MISVAALHRDAVAGYYVQARGFEREHVQELALTREANVTRQTH